MATPALAYPITVLINDSPVAEAVKTNNKRVWFVTGTFNPVKVPEVMEPMDKIPVNDGDNVALAPGTAVKLLSGVVERYNVARIVIFDPIKDNAAVVLK